MRAKRSRCGRWRSPTSMLTAYAVSEPRPDSLAPPESFAAIADTGGALGGVVHRARQGADPSALRELPSGRRPSAPGRRGPAAPAAGRARPGRSWPRGHALSDLPPEGQLRARPRARPSGVASRAASKWRGRARRSARSARRSRTPRATAADRSRSSIHHIGDRHAGRLGLGARVRPQPRSRHAEGGRRAGRGLGEDRRRVPEQMTPPRRNLRGLQVSGLATCFWNAGRCFRRSW